MIKNDLTDQINRRKKQRSSEMVDHLKTESGPAVRGEIVLDFHQRLYVLKKKQKQKNTSKYSDVHLTVFF